MNIEYKINEPISVKQFIQVLTESTLAERRPIHDVNCIEGMLNNSNLLVTAWDKQHLVGLARSVTDFHYACYLSDLAVAKSHSNSGIGRQLQKLTQLQLHAHCKLILIAAPDANEYYRHIGYQHHTRCWILERSSEVQ